MLWEELAVVVCPGIMFIIQAECSRVTCGGSQVANNLCDQLDTPETRQSCNGEPCLVTSPGLALRFTPYGLCEADCGTGVSARAAFCANPYGLLTDDSACSDYSGETRAPMITMC